MTKTRNMSHILPVVLLLATLVMGSCNKQKDYYIDINPSNVDSTLFLNSTWTVQNSTLSNAAIDTIASLKDFDMEFKQIYFGNPTCVIKIGNKTTTEYNGRYEIQHATNSRLRLYDITQGSHEGVYYVFTFREINVSPHYSAILELSEFGADSISVSRGGKAMGIIRIQRN